MMKPHTLCLLYFAYCALWNSVSQVVSAPVEDGKRLTDESPRSNNNCPSVCPFNFDPVCAVDSCDYFKTFGNECQRRVFNCKNRTSFRTVARAQCVEDTN